MGIIKLFFLCILSYCFITIVQAIELGVNIREFEFEGPEQDPEHVDRVWGGLDNWKKGDAVIHLNDANFEHLTQSASGWTTGDWFVMFGAPWCKHCKAMMLNWNETARDLKGEINVAVIDASYNPFTAQRFNITAYPTVILLRQGRAYEYKGDRYWKKMIVFARLEYQNEPSFKIPPAHGTFDELVVRLQEWSGKVLKLYETNPMLFFGSIFGGIFFGCFLPFAYVFSAQEDPSWIVVKTPNRPLPNEKAADDSAGTEGVKNKNMSTNKGDEKTDVTPVVENSSETPLEQVTAPVESKQRKNKRKN
jgi:thiol-disulfide isomerase/thioredoxin